MTIDSQSVRNPMRRVWWVFGSIASIFGLLVLAGVPLVGIAAGNYKNYWTPASSMAPTLKVGDRMFVSLKIEGPVKRGDIFVMKCGEVDYVKRIVGLPGDRIELSEGVVVLNGAKITPRYLRDESNFDTNEPTKKARIFSELLPGESHAHEIADFGESQGDYFGLVDVPAEHYFVLGDNRDNSADGRFSTQQGGCGFVHKSKLVGRPLFIYWRTGEGLIKRAI